MESQFIQRNNKKSIDVHKSIHAFAMALGRQVQEEDTIRKDKVLRKAIRETILEWNKQGCMRITMSALVSAVAAKVFKASDNHNVTISRIEKHIRLNVGRYLNVEKGKSGGVSLLKKGKP